MHDDVFHRSQLAQALADFQVHRVVVPGIDCVRTACLHERLHDEEIRLLHTVGEVRVELCVKKRSDNFGVLLLILVLSLSWSPPNQRVFIRKEK